MTRSASCAHLGLETRDLHRLERFYREALGFSLLYRHVSRRTPGLRCTFLQGRGLTLELCESPGAVPATEGLHLALDAADWDTLAMHLATLGLPLDEEPRVTGDGMREARLRDPDGRFIELASRVRPFRAQAPRAFIFDLDATLIDSEPNYYEADRLLLADFGIVFSPEDKRHYVGVGNTWMMHDLKRRFDLPVSEEELLERKNRYYMDLARRCTPAYPEMVAMVRQAQARGLKLAVASGSSPAVIRELLGAVGLADAFPVCVSSEDVPHSKPAPDVFLLAAERLGVSPGETLVFEDSRFGVESGLRGGFRVVAVPYITDEPLDFIYSMADLLFPAGQDAFRAQAVWDYLAETTA